MANNLGILGVWASIDELTAPEAVQFAQQLEHWGYSALWIVSYMAAHTKKLIFATGIANIYARDPMSMNAIHQTVSELALRRTGMPAPTTFAYRP